MKSLSGFTLYEALCTIAILSVLTSLSLPKLNSFINSSRTKQLHYTIFTLIQYVRSKSILLHEDIILCPSIDDKECINNWQLPLMIFIDINKNKRRDESEVIDRKVYLSQNGEKLIWRASGTSRYLRFHTNGLTHSQNGSFIICPRNQNIEDTYKIVLYFSGRARTATKEEITSKDCA